MARIGFKKAKYNIVDSETNKYKNETPKDFEKVVEEKFAGEYNSAELYANDSLVESDCSFIKGTLTLTVVDDDDTLLSELFGNTTKTNEISQKIDDTAPYFGYGHVIPKIVNGVRKYKVEYFPKVKFTKVTSDNKTRGASVEFSTTELEASVFPLGEKLNGVDAGTWEKHQTFDDFASAEDYLNTLLSPFKDI